MMYCWCAASESDSLPVILWVVIGISASIVSLIAIILIVALCVNWMSE